MKPRAFDARDYLNLKGMPFDAEVERCVLGACMVDGVERFAVLRASLDETHFHLGGHRAIWTAMCELHDMGLSMDRVSLWSHLTMRDMDRMIDGGLAYLVDLDAGMPLNAPVDGWVKVLQQKSDLRAAIAHLNGAMLACFQEDAGAVEAARASMLSIAEASTARAATLSAKDIIDRIGFEEFCHPRQSLEGQIRTPAKWPSLAKHLPYLTRKNLIVLAAGTGQGKSTFAMQIAGELALEGRRTLIASMEMAQDEILPRMACQVACVDSFRQKHGRLNSNERIAFMEASSRLYEAPLFIDDRGTQTVASIEALARKTKAELVVVDYLQLVRPTGRHDSRAVAVGEVSRGLKRLAQDLNVPVLALSQFNRSSGKEDRKPELYDLRESGSIENDANTVFFVWSSKQDWQATGMPVEILIRKNRLGTVGEMKMFFDKTRGIFVDD